MGVSFYVIKVEKAFIAIIKKKTFCNTFYRNIYCCVCTFKALGEKQFFLTKACQIQ